MQGEELSPAPLFPQDVVDLIARTVDEGHLHAASATGYANAILIDLAKAGYAITPLRSPSREVNAPATRTEDQAFAEIRDVFADTMLNMAQRKTFVISILRGQLANPPNFGGYNG